MSKPSRRRLTPCVECGKLSERAECWACYKRAARARKQTQQLLPPPRPIADKPVYRCLRCPRAANPASRDPRLCWRCDCLQEVARWEAA